MGRSRSECPTDADLAAGLSAASRGDRVKADFGPGGRQHRQLHAGRIGRMAATGRQDPERSSRSGQHGLAGLSANRRRRTGSTCSARISTVLPQLRQSVLELLEELPMDATGLGATEMRMLELISAGNAGPFDVFPGDDKPNKRRVFGYWEIGALLDGLAHCPEPAVSGLDEGPFTLEMHDDRDRLERYRRSRAEAHCARPGDSGRDRRFQPAQSDPPLVGRHRIDQRSPVALGSGEPRFDRAFLNRIVIERFQRALVA